MEMVASDLRGNSMLTPSDLDANSKVFVVRHALSILEVIAMVDISVIRLVIIVAREAILSMSSRVSVSAFDAYITYYNRSKS